MAAEGGSFSAEHGIGALKRDGGLDAVKDRLAGFEERQRLVDKATYDALEKRYAVE